MTSSAYIHTISMSRRIASGQNTDGDQVVSLTKIYTNIPARVETERSMALYTEGGVRPYARYIFIYVDSIYPFILRDQITFNGVLIGEVGGIDVGWLGTNNIVDHYELKILTS